MYKIRFRDILSVGLILIVMGWIFREIGKAYDPKPITSLARVDTLVHLKFPAHTHLIEALDQTSLQGASTLAVVTIPPKDLAAFQSQAPLKNIVGPEVATAKETLETAPAKERFTMRHWSMSQTQHYRILKWQQNTDEHGLMLIDLDHRASAIVYIYFWY